MSRHFSIIASFVFAFAACGLAQQTTAPSNNAEHLKATITGVEGLVQVRANDTAKWEKATVGMVLNEEAEFRTGIKSAVRFTLPPDQTVTLDRLGAVKLLQAINDNGKIKTNIGMSFGRTRYEIEAAGREHESTITSPSATLAVRGTTVALYDQRPFAAEATSLTGRAEFRDFKKRTFLGKKNGSKTRIDTNSSSAAAFALGESVVDPGERYARTAAEEQLVTTLLSSGATIGFDYNKGIRVVRGGSVPQTDSQLVPILPGTLNFVLRWPGPTDLNLAVVATNTGPGNQTVYPLGGFDHTASGGRTPFDHQGGPNGGIEIAYWLDNAPNTRYFVGAQLISGPNATATLDVFKDGVRVPITTGNGQVTTAHQLITPIDPNIATAVGIGTVNLAPPAKTAPSAKFQPVMNGPKVVKH